MAKSSFRDKVKAAAGKEKTGGASYGYLNLPKGIKVFSPEPGGKHTLDFIPYEVTDKYHLDRDTDVGIAVPGELWYKKPFKVHRNVGVNEETVVCPTTFGKPCPICDYAKKRKDEGAEQDELKALRPSKRNLYAVIPIGEKKHEESIHVWDSSQFLFQDLLNEELEENDDYLVFPDLEEGLSLKIRFDKTTFGSSKPFATASRIDFLKRKEGYNEDILEEVPNLDEMLKVLSYKEIDNLFMGEELAGDEDDDETPKHHKASKKKEDDEEEEKPKSKKDPKLTWEDLQDMEDEELCEVAESNDIEIDPEEGINVLRNTIAKELGIEIPRKKEVTRTRTANKPEDKRKTKEKDDEEEETPKAKVTGKNACVACGGTGLTSRGKKCPICDGTGRKPSDKEDDEEEETSKSKKGTTSKNKCPYGYKFGTDCDQFDDCDSCEKWDECSEEK